MKSGSGPFVLDEYQRGNFYKVSKNSNYFKEGRPFFESIDHFIIPDSSRFISALKAGQVDMANAGGAASISTLNAMLEENLKRKVLTHFLAPSFNLGLMINVKKEPFTDPRVRKAIYLAIDRQQLNDIVLDGTGGVTSVFIPNMVYSEEEAITWPGVRPKNTPGGRADLAEAKRLMAEAGFPEGFKTTFDARQVSYYVLTCQVIKEQLKAALGIDGDLRVWESSAGYNNYNTARPANTIGDWDLACQGEGTTVMDADSVFGGVYRKGGTRNYTDWSHPIVEDLFQLQKVEQNFGKRRELLRETADFLRGFSDNHWVTLAWGRFFWPVHRDIKGFHPPQTVQYGFKHEDLWLER